MRSRLDRRLVGRATAVFFVLTLLLVWRHPHWTNGSLHRVARFDAAAAPPGAGADAADRALCRAHGWAPFRKKAAPAGRPRRVYDLFMVNTELDWLEIRLNTTYDVVDYFVIVESPKTFTNRDKPLVIKDNLHRLAAYRDKIIYHLLEIPDGFHSDRPNPAWAWEDLQRNAMYDQVLPRLAAPQAPEPGDVIVVADVDEIVRPETLRVLRACDFPRRLTLRSAFYYYSFQFLHRGEQWAHPQATYYEGARTLLPVNLRNADGGLPPLVWLDQADLWDAGWHCSSCFSTVEEQLTKMASFSHQWMNQDYFRDRDRIADYVRQGKDLWDRPTETYTRVEDNRDVPDILLRQRERFAYLMDRDGPSAGFQDYP